MLNDKHFKVLQYEPNASKVFSNTEIKGGVAITIRDEMKSPGAIKVFTSHPELNHIVKRIVSYDGNSEYWIVLFLLEVVIEQRSYFLKIFPMLQID